MLMLYILTFSNNFMRNWIILAFCLLLASSVSFAQQTQALKFSQISCAPRISDMKSPIVILLPVSNNKFIEDLCFRNILHDASTLESVMNNCSSALSSYNYQDNFSVIKNLCAEDMPDSVYAQIITSPCSYFAPLYTINEGQPGYNYNSLEGGWHSFCRIPSSGSDYSTFTPFLIILTLLFPLGFIALPLIFLLFLLIYAIIIIKRKQKLINYYALPVFYGIIGGIIGAAVKRKEWKSFIGVGLLTTFIMLFALVVFYHPFVVY
jgi:hypothetical protein